MQWRKERSPCCGARRGEHLVIENGAVRGVIGKKDGKTVAIRATRGVALTCGGFEFNDFVEEELPQAVAHSLLRQSGQCRRGNQYVAGSRGGPSGT